MIESEIGTIAANVVAQTDPAADTETLVETIQLPYDITIKEINFNFANVVDAKSMSGFMELKFSGGETPFRYPIGFGVGGATSTNQKEKGTYNVNIPVDANEKIEMYATMCEACVGMWIGLKYKRGKEGKTTFGDCNTAEDAAVSADAFTPFAAITIPPKKGGIIKKILVAYGNVVNAKAASGYVQLDFSESKGRQRYPVGAGAGGATNSQGKVEAEKVDTDIPIPANDIVTPALYLAEAAVDAHVGIIWEA